MSILFRTKSRTSTISEPTPLKLVNGEPIIPYRYNDFKYRPINPECMGNPLDISPDDFNAKINTSIAERERLECDRITHLRESLLSQHPNIVENTAKGILNGIRWYVELGETFPLPFPEISFDWFYQDGERVLETEADLRCFFEAIKGDVDAILMRYGYATFLSAPGNYVIIKQQQ